MLLAVVCLLLFVPIFIICHTLAGRLTRITLRSKRKKEAKDSSLLYHGMGDELTIEVDLSGVKTPEDVHDRLGIAFHFPDYYGQNWDSFDECISDLENPPKIIRITGLEGLKAGMPREARLLRECLRDYQEGEEGHGVEVQFKMSLAEPGA